MNKRKGSTDNLRGEPLANPYHDCTSDCESAARSSSDRASWKRDEEVLHVDKNDHGLGSVSRDIAHTKGLLHRAFAVFLFDGEGRILLCRRSEKKRLWPRYWTDSCSGHPFPGEDTVAAAERRVLEELGCETTLSNVGWFIYRMAFEESGIEHELCHVLIGRAGHLVVNPDEVSEVRPVSPQWLAEQTVNPPKDFSPWLVHAIRAFSPFYLSDRLAQIR